MLFRALPLTLHPPCFLSRHNEPSSKMENSGTSSLSEDAADDVYPVMLRISAVQGTNVLTVKICKKVCLDIPIFS